MLRNEQLKLRLAKLLRERFGASSEKPRSAIEQLELLLGDLDEQFAETTPAESEPSAASVPSETIRRKLLPASLPRDIVDHAAPCACPQCGGTLRPLGEDVTEVLDYVPGAFRVIRHVRPKLSCRSCSDAIWSGRLRLSLMECSVQCPVQTMPAGALLIRTGIDQCLQGGLIDQRQLRAACVINHDIRRTPAV